MGLPAVQCWHQQCVHEQPQSAAGLAGTLCCVQMGKLRQVECWEGALSLSLALASPHACDPGGCQTGHSARATQEQRRSPMLVQQSKPAVQLRAALTQGMSLHGRLPTCCHL